MLHAGWLLEAVRVPLKQPPRDITDVPETDRSKPNARLCWRRGAEAPTRNTDELVIGEWLGSMAHANGPFDSILACSRNEGEQDEFWAL